MKERIPVTVFVQIANQEPDCTASPSDRVDVRLVSFNWDTFENLKNLPQLYTMRNEVASLPNSMADERDDVLEEIVRAIRRIEGGRGEDEGAGDGES
jgi:hypothetical protein